LHHRAVLNHLEDLADPAIAARSARFFKTGPGEYGEGDRFLGIRVPVLRRTLRRFGHLGREEALPLLRSPWHEVRLFALLLWVRCFERGRERARRAVYTLYLANTRHINSWDLVDSSAHHIVGAWLEERDRGPLRRLARSADLWERRIAVVATWRFIRRGEFDPTLELATRLLDDGEDLIHKAVGWMLREVGKRDGAVLRAFLGRHRSRMPRTALRYAIERFPEAERRSWLRGDGP